MLTKEEVHDWLQQPTTKEVLKIMQGQLDDQIATIGSGGVLADTADETAIKTARVVGRIDGLSYLFNIEEDMEE